MQFYNQLEIVQLLLREILKSRYSQKIDANFNIECNYVKKIWKDGGSNQLVLQFFIKMSKLWLVEEWNILIQGDKKCSSLVLEQCLPMVKLSQLQKHTLEHKLLQEDKKSTNWNDPSLIRSKSLTVESLTVNIAYLANLNFLENESLDNPYMYRDRFMSDEVEPELKYHRQRKNSLHQEKNKALINHLKTTQLSPNGSTKLLSIVNTKEDVEILSNAEDAQKFIDENNEDEFEIQMIIDDSPLIRKLSSEAVIVHNEETDTLLKKLTQLKRVSHPKFSHQINVVLNLLLH